MWKIRLVSQYRTELFAFEKYHRKKKNCFTHGTHLWKYFVKIKSPVTIKSARFSGIFVVASIHYKPTHLKPSINVSKSRNFRNEEGSTWETKSISLKQTWKRMSETWIEDIRTFKTGDQLKIYGMGREGWYSGGCAQYFDRQTKCLCLCQPPVVIRPNGVRKTEI